MPSTAIAIVCALAAQAAPAPAAPTGPGPGAADQPCAALPQLPLRRTDPRVWEVKFEASVWAPGSRTGSTAPIKLRDAAVVFPLLQDGAWSRTDPAQALPELWLEARKVGAPSVQVLSGLPRCMSAVRLGIGAVSGQSVRWSVSWRSQCWASQVDEATAAAATWPTEWPAAAREWLNPEPGIESGTPEMAAFVERVSEGKLRSVTPWIAAKELVRATLNHFNAVDNDGIQVENGFPRGIVFGGATAAMTRRTGTSHDVAAACTAVLRTAGIPARLVLGVTEVQMSSGKSKARLVTWCELWLPGAGWAPYSPLELRGSARGGLQLQRPWPAFGTWDELNRHIPLCLGVTVPAPGTNRPAYPAGYAWTARGSMDTWQSTEAVTVQILSRGRGSAP
jgi:transglutaminase-like putative cysteine protease